MEFHPLANLFPLLEGGALDALSADIAAHGIRDPLVTYEGMILDGRNRWRAAGKAGVTIIAKLIKEFDSAEDGDPLAWVISKNLERRHLDESQRAMVGARLATLRDGQRQVGKFAEVLTQDQASKLINASERSIRSARHVLNEGVPELAALVDQGKLAVSVAANAAKLSDEDQREVAARAETGEANVVRKVVKQKSRANREANLATRQRALPERKFGVIYADPEWRFETWSEKGLINSSPDMHYPTSDLEEIKARDVPSIAADDSVLFLWATPPMLPHALEVMAAWGFGYVTNAVWIKDRNGTGYWFRFRHEHLLVGVRGSIPCPAPGLQWDSVIEQPRGDHSQKPETVCDLIETYFPNLPKIELNRRGPARPGWEAWGNEAEVAA